MSNLFLSCIPQWCAFLTFVIVAGCGDGSAPKKSLFESDHVIPEHWPSGLADVSVKLRERMQDSDGFDNPQVILEIRDLVGWTAEVAADTDLSETDWIPVHERSEALSKILLSRDQWGEAERASLEELCDLIDASVKKIPDPRALVSGGRS